MSRIKMLSAGLALTAAALLVDMRPAWFGLSRAPEQPTLKSLERRLASSSPDRRLEALKQALALDTDDTPAVAARFLGDPSAAVRLEAILYFDHKWNSDWYLRHAHESLPAAAFVQGLYDPEPELAVRFAKQVADRARRSDLPGLIAYLLSRRAEWEVPNSEAIVGLATGRLGGFDSHYKETDMTAMCGNPYMAAEGEIFARPWWKKLLGPSDAVAQNELSLHYDVDRYEWDVYRENDPSNRAARERVLAWWRRSGEMPHVAEKAPLLRPDRKAFLREHPVETTITQVGTIRYERGGFVRVIPVTVGAGSHQGLFVGAELRYPSFEGPTDIELTAVSFAKAEGVARQYPSTYPLEVQRLPVPGQRVTSRQTGYDELEAQ